MSIGRTKEEQELTNLLSRTLVQKEVIEPMTKMGWGHGTPPPPDYGTTPPAEGAPAATNTQPTPPVSGQPAPGQAPQASGTVPAKADTPLANDIVSMFEGLREANGLIMGKYKTVPEALKGAGHLAQMASTALSENDKLKQQLAALVPGALQARTQPVTSPVMAPVPEPASLVASRAKVTQAQAKLDAVLSRVDDNGGIVDGEILRAQNLASRELAEAAAEVRVQEMQQTQTSAADAEQRRWAAVDEFMGTNYPQSLLHAAEIGLHVQSDPVLQEAVSALVAQGKEIRASELAWQSYERAVNDGRTVVERANAEAKEADLTAKEQVRQELLDKARRDAGVIQGSSGAGIHMNDDAGTPSRDEINAAVAQMRNEGEGVGMPAATRFRHLLIGRHLDPSIFGGR